MRTVALASVLLFSCAQEKQVSPVVQSKLAAEGISRSNDPCANLSTPKPGAHCGYEKCEREERVRIACDFKFAVLDRYAGVFQKAERIPGFSAPKHLQGCVDAEAAETDDFLPPFIDRMRACVAGFQDTHFSFEATRAVPVVTVRIGATLTRGSLFVTRVISDLDPADSGAPLPIELGDEILSVDGKPPLEALAPLKKYINGSSDLYITHQAAAALFSRNFVMPTSSSLLVSFKKKSGEVKEAKLPWHYNHQYDRPDYAKLFAKAGVVGVGDIGFEKDGTRRFKDWYGKNSGTPWEGYNAADTAFSLAAGEKFQEYARKINLYARRPAVRLGIISIRGKKVGYIQLLSFSTYDVFDVSAGSDAPMKDLFTDVFRPFIKRLKAENLDLIYDLRSNGGGSPYLANQLFSLITEEGKKYASDTTAMRTSDSYGTSLWREKQDPAFDAKDWTDLFSLFDYADAFKKAYEAGFLHTAIFQNRDITADPEVGGYPGKVIALVSDACISACDQEAALLGHSKRAVIIGSPSNGTGYGFNGGDGICKWIDWHGLITASFPVDLFGVGVTAAGAEKVAHIFDFESFKEKLLLENKPTPPDVAYEPTVDDLLGRANGWEDLIAKELGVGPVVGFKEKHSSRRPAHLKK